jgi:hypothetical protein
MRRQIQRLTRRGARGVLFNDNHGGMFTMPAAQRAKTEKHLRDRQIIVPGAPRTAFWQK